MMLADSPAESYASTVTDDMVVPAGRPLEKSNANGPHLSVPGLKISGSRAVGAVKSVFVMPHLFMRRHRPR